MRKLLLLPCLLISQSLLAEESIWSDIGPPHQYRQSNSTEASDIQASRHLKLNITALEQLLTVPINTAEQEKYLDLPLPDGQQLKFKFEPSNTMAPGLAERYPQIKTWKVSNIDNPSIYGSIDLTPNGFHGLINTADGERIYIDPNGDSDLNEYISRKSQATSTGNSPFNCQVHGESALASPQTFSKIANRTANRTADSFRTYRIAIATTGEYAQLFGGTKSNALASVVTTVNRLNQVFERDLSVHLELVENNDDILYTSPSTDPYSNEDASAMVEENILNIDTIIGTDSYDIGHVFGTGNTGGLAFLRSACGDYKAGGVTGSNSPSGEAFNIDYVAHEIGHQLGASHTFNGHQLNCSASHRETETAVEPGSGSSIMAYAGICGTDNLQSNSDAFFHSVSIKQIKAFTQNSYGANCGVLTTKSNSDPTVSAGEDYTIPAETPFKLTGITSDVDADQVSHSWEQVDIGTAGGLYTDLIDNPLFRTWPPISSASRYFPRLIDTLNHKTSIGELLPTTSRKMNFTLLTRDNKGGVSEDEMTVTVVNTGKPFAVLSHATATTLSANQSIDVSWDIANTTEPPISCSHVNVGLIDNSGMTTSLLTNIPNDGDHTLTIPSDIISIQNSRLQISCVGNVFFAVSEGEINVLGGYPVITVNAPSINEEDSGIRNLAFILSLSATATENIAVNYEVTDSSSSAIVKQGVVIINQGSNTANILIPVTGDTFDEENQILNLSLEKPLNAQFANERSLLTSQGTIIDDDTATIAASPETPTPSGESSGGGSFSLFSIIGLLLLGVRRKNNLRIK